MVTNLRKKGKKKYFIAIAHFFNTNLKVFLVPEAEHVIVYTINEVQPAQPCI